MANWYSSYTFPFNKNTFPAYVGNNFSSLGIEDSTNISKTIIGTITIGGTTYDKYRLSTGLVDLKGGAICFFKTNDGCMYVNRNNYSIKKPAGQSGTITTSGKASFSSSPDYWIKITSGNK